MLVGSVPNLDILKDIDGGIRTLFVLFHRQDPVPILDELLGHMASKPAQADDKHIFHCNIPLPLSNLNLFQGQFTGRLVFLGGKGQEDGDGSHPAKEHQPRQQRFREHPKRWSNAKG